jgi:hypothetical protein
LFFNIFYNKFVIALSAPNAYLALARYMLNLIQLSRIWFSLQLGLHCSRAGQWPFARWAVSDNCWHLYEGEDINELQGPAFS